MAKIFIKTRREPIVVSVEFATKTKRRWLGDEFNHVEKADPRDVVDLGEWAGEYGQIKSIDTNPEPVDPQINQEKKKLEEEKQTRIKEEEFRKLSPEEKANNLGFFRLSWSVRNNFTNKPIPEPVLKQAYKIQLKYYQQNPFALNVPISEFKYILPKEKAVINQNLVEQIPE